MTASNDKRRLGTSQVCERGTFSSKNDIVKGKGLDLRTESTCINFVEYPPDIKAIYFEQKWIVLNDYFEAALA